MKEKPGEIFSIAGTNPCIAGCTVSKEVYSKSDSYIIHFAMAAHTDISAEIYQYHKWIYVAEGSLCIYAPSLEKKWHLQKGGCLITPINTPVGMFCEQDTVFTEISFGKENTMNTCIEMGEIFHLADLLPYQEGKVVNMDVCSNKSMKFLIMSFDKGTGLAEHAAPGEALLFGLDGEGLILYEGKEHILKPGDNFVFAKNGKHAIRADKPFKMAILLTLE